MMYLSISLKMVFCSVLVSVLLGVHNAVTADEHSSDFIIKKLLSRQPAQGFSLLAFLTRSSRLPASVQEEYRELDGDLVADKASDPEDVAEMMRPAAYKRSLGACIDSCMRINKTMNFIQCKSMCH